VLEQLQKMLAAGKDSALLRFSLGNEWLKRDDAATAVEHLTMAVALDPKYSAAWKLLGKAREAAGDFVGAAETYRKGIETAQANGDQQAVREMQVFLKRVEKR